MGRHPVLSGCKTCSPLTSRELTATSASQRALTRSRPEQRSGRVRCRARCRDGLSGYQYVKFPETARKFAKARVESLPAHTGYRISELPHRAAHGEVRAAYIMGCAVSAAKPMRNFLCST
ncbi:hypothetical protein KCP78_21865 [Salmonella enterica subsp. enterica]|nr:hypothetical protein KCP78_21865 [Salmonella enterica subsp. enterica]